MSTEIPAHPCCKHCGNGCCVPGHAEPCDQCFAVARAHLWESA